MGTRSAAFAGKISNLRENILRIQNGTMPQPTCLDLANIMKYFCQVLYDFRDFKDIENVPLYAHEKRDRVELIKSLPNFDYSGLYKTLSQLVDILPLIPPTSNGLDQLGSNLLMLFKCLVPFLDQTNMETMPYLVSSLFMSLPASLHKDILDTLCFNLLSFTIVQQNKLQKNVASSLVKSRSLTSKAQLNSGSKRPVHCIVRIEDPNDQIAFSEDNARSSSKTKSADHLEDQGIGSDSELGSIDGISSVGCGETEEYALLSVTSILMIAFHYITEPTHHSQLIECLMKLKNNVFDDLLYVIAYGTTRARCPAVEILFRYWPDVCPNQQDRKNISQASKLKHIPWQPTKCQNKDCSFTTLGDDEAVKMCLDFKLSITLSGLAPPMLVCLDCVDTIYKQQLAASNASGISSLNATLPGAIDDYSSKFIDLLLPMQKISKLCENKKCKSSDKSAIGTCFDIECANYNCKKPIRYCKSCFMNIHEPCGENNYDVTLQNHIRHSSLDLNIMDNEDRINNFIEAIISLLKEAAPIDRPSKDSERYLRSLMGPTSQFNIDNKDHLNIATEEKQLISQYGIWLMTGLCKSTEKLSDDLLGRLLGMLFQWFHFTACLPDDQAGSALEKLKGECIKGWIMGVKNERIEVFISCLLPHPIDCSKIGGHWEVWPDTAHQIKEGFKRLLCLVPYDIITDDVWDEIMPYWMECFRHEVPENELNELKILLSKVFDPELSPLGFETKQMYNFISSRFEECTSSSNQEQTLYWLQIITMLEIPIPIDFLYQMLKSGVKSLAVIRAEELKKLKQPTRRDENSKDAQSGAAETTSSHSSANSPHGSSQGSLNCLHSSQPEDEVLLPSTESIVDENESAFRSQREKQARARAAFSARVLQQVSLMDAKASGSDPPPSSSSVLATAPLELAPPVTEASTVTLGVHSKPIKSISDVRLAEKESSDVSSSRPKLQLQLGESSGVAAQTFEQVESKKESSTSGDDGYDGIPKIDNNLVCYILMIDILLKQLDLQEVSSHRGLEVREAQQAIELLNAIISTPWIGKHTCCETLPHSPNARATQPSTSSQSDTAGSSSIGNTLNQQQQQQQQQIDELIADSVNQLDPSSVHSFGHCAQGFEHEDTYETCVFCEIISTFHQLAMFLIEFFAPLIEVSICEVNQDTANGEFQGQPDYSRVGLDHLGEEQAFNFSTSSTCSKLPTNAKNQTPSSEPSISPSLKAEVLAELPKELQLTYNLLVQFHKYQAPDIVSQLLQMIKLLSLHSQVLSKAAKQNIKFISWCQHNMLMGKLWSLCQLESSEIARTCVPLLLHCITLPWGVRLFRDLVERDFNSENWLARFRAVERVVTIAHFCEPSTIKNSSLLQSTMASAFCYVVRCLDDIEAIVAQRALVSLEMMKTGSLKLLLWCLEVQFDYIISDRPMILRSVFQLYNHLRDRRFLTWEFFLNRFDTIFLEAQIYLQQTGEIPSFTMQDLKNTNTKSELYQKKIVRAREALQETHQPRSLSGRFQERQFSSLSSSTSFTNQPNHPDFYRESLKLQKQQQQQQATTGANKLPTRSPLKRVIQHGRSTSSRYQSVALLTSQSLVRRKNSKFMANLAMQSVPPMMLPDKLHQHLPNSFVDDGSKLNEIAQENHVFGVVHRVCDEDRDTNHSLIFLLMQFFSKPDPSHPQTMKTLNRNHQIVLRHLNILMGYSVARKNFLIAPTNLRLLPCFNAFLTSLPKVLDFNFPLGTILLDTCLPILIYCPASDETQFDSLKTPNYSLWLLNPLMRHSWLMSVMTFLYKYQFSQAHLKDQVYQLMWIVINTLESHLNCNIVHLTRTVQCPLEASGNNNRLVSVRETGANTATNREEKLVDPSTNPPSESTGSGTRQTGTGTESHNKNEHLELTEIPTSGRQDAIATENSPPLSSQKHTPSTTTSVVDENTSKMAASKELQPVSEGSSHTTKTTSKVAPSANRKSTGLTDTSLVVTSKTTAPTTSRAVNKVVDDFTSSAEPSSDERLLPIGLPVRIRATTNDIPNSERLLPIGISSINREQTVVSTDDSATGNAAVQNSSESKSKQLTVSSNTNTSEHRSSDLDQSAPAGRGSPSFSSATTSSPMTSKLQKSRRFGASSKQQIADVAKHQATATGTITCANQQPDSPANASPLAQADVSSSNSSSTSGAWLSGKKGRAGKGVSSVMKEYRGPSANSQATLQANSSSPSLLSEQLAQINRHSLVQEFSDKDLSLCLVILETFIHHEPSMAAQMLPNILRLVARYSSASFDSWQSASNVHLIGGSMFVARQFIRVALHDLMENNIFQQIFTSHFTGFDFYKSMATALADFTDLNQLAPLSKLFEDLNKQKNLPQASSLMTILENVATYFECIIGDQSTSHSQTTWTNFIANWENFLRKLILALPRFSGSVITTTSSGSSRANGTSLMAHTSAPSASHFQQTASSGPASQLVASSSGAGGTAVGLGNSGCTSGSSNLHPAATNQFLIGSHRAAAGDSAQNAAMAASAIPSSCSMIMAPIMRIILSTSKISHMASCKTLVDPYSKIISYTVLNSQFKYEHLLEINHNLCRLYTRDREKYLIQRTIAYELVQVLKFRFFILEENLLILLLFVLQDVGGALSPKVVRDSLKIEQSTLNQADSFVTNVSECLRQYIGDLLEFITDVHAISRINDNLIGSRPSPASSINRDSFGGHVKAAISQYLALEMSISNGADNRTVLRYLPWLYTSPSLQQGPREFIDCVSHIRQLSWIILGSLQHSTLSKVNSNFGATGTASSLFSNQASSSAQAAASSGVMTLAGTGVSGITSGGAGTSTASGQQHSSHSHVICQPVPIEKNGNIAEHVQVILAGFAEQSKESVLHMSGLFHAFLLCQLWTMYCENICSQHPPNSEQYQFSQSTLDDFWAKITPGVLRLVGHSRVMSEMVSTHFLQLIESLIESNSSILIRYLPLWNSVFYSYKRRNKSGNLAIRLQKCIEWQPPDLNEQDVEQNNKRLINWLEKVQYKMSHIEIQSSQAAPFYLT